MINPLAPRLLPDPSALRWPTVNSGCAHTDPLQRITITRSAARHLSRTRPLRHPRLLGYLRLRGYPRLLGYPRLRARPFAHLRPFGWPLLQRFPRPPLPPPPQPPIPPARRRRRQLAVAVLVLALLTAAVTVTTTASATASASSADSTSASGSATASASTPDTPVTPPGLTGPTARFSWPLPAPHPVLRPFQPPATPYGPGHRGVDLGGSVGEPVLAAGDGLVLYAGALFNCDLISIEHPGGLRTTYTPVVPSVRVGEQVTRREQIGTLLAAQPGCPEEVGNNGTGPPVFLYWGVHRDRNYLDPLRLVETGEVRLLPWPGDDQ